MTLERRLERDLPDILADLAAGPYPNYIDDVLTSTARRRQHAAWPLPERWLPMVEIARQPVLAPAVPWRSISIAFMTVAFLVTAVTAFVGSLPRLPKPFGPAANGLVAYAAGGDIYTADPVSGHATAIVSGPETDIGPRYSPDGTLVVFARMVDSGRGNLYVARSDGTDPTRVTPEPMAFTESRLGEPWEQYQFSPDGRSLLIAAEDNHGFPTISIVKVDGSGARDLAPGMAAFEPSFRPPDGAEILFVGHNGNTRTFEGLYAIDPSTDRIRTIIEPSPEFGLAGATWSPDGSKIAYWSWTQSDSITAETHVVSADGTGDHALPVPADAVWNAGSEWSNDGTRLLVFRGYTPGHEDVRAVVIPADGSSLGAEIRVPVTIQGECCSAWQWAPDDSVILGTPVDVLKRPQQQIILDPSSGTTRPAPWASTSDPTWQRVAP